jgi:hypothetical protein
MVVIFRGNVKWQGGEGFDRFQSMGQLREMVFCLFILSEFRIRIRIHRIHVFFGLPDPDPLVTGMDPDLDPDPSIIMQK